jgi:hypothetical protein
MENNLPAETKVSDLTVEDVAKVNKFFEAGAPGFSLTDEAQVTKLMDLYLSGKTYSQISRIYRVPKELVMAYSYKLNWFKLKIDYLAEMELHLRNRIVDAKITSQDFLLQLTQMYQKKIAKNMDLYHQTGNEVHADKINLKEIDKYLKLVDALAKLSAEQVPAKSPAKTTPSIGLNVGDGVTITKTDDNTVEVTPRQKTTGEMLKELANMRREEDRQKAKKSSDIKDVTPQGEKK